MEISSTTVAKFMDLLYRAGSISLLSHKLLNLLDPIASLHLNVCSLVPDLLLRLLLSLSHLGNSVVLLLKEGNFLLERTVTPIVESHSHRPAEAW